MTAAVVKASGVASGEPLINFAAHQVRAGTDGAREDFQDMICQLVRAIHPGARTVATNPGDWAIDAFVGNLGGQIAVWQCKYFFPKTTKAHQQQIHKSFKSALESAKREGYTIKQWTLCLASSMDGPTAKWWEGWKKRNQRANNLEIQLWDDTEIRGLLISPDAADVRRHYFGTESSPAKAEMSLRDVPSDVARELDHTLFVLQLREAGHTQVSSAKRQFFNADLMAREIVDKGVPAEISALNTADAVVQTIWEDRFNQACVESGGPQLPGLHGEVMNDIRNQHGEFAKRLPGGLIHSRGLMHRVVDDRRAGWVTNWEDIADAHVSRPSDAALTFPDRSVDPTETLKHVDAGNSPMPGQEAAE
ncbi:hypothetical protein QWI29_12980 [Mycolicibacterium neoaurum]|uniref:hypothetical protein n=1 Tax=Mycolicibacterium neoaurum TaxID=1795 RepID=UPI002670D36B|nr:hypothetical protein [Mycolicibacterium neoaurum]MDO3400947.1 hypothetical protein [Mycolicibacterium neoaurum]